MPFQTVRSVPYYVSIDSTCLCASAQADSFNYVYTRTRRHNCLGFFLAFSQQQLFYAERQLYMHERANRFYYPSVYYSQKVLFDVVPLRIIPPAIMGTITCMCNAAACVC